MKIYIAGKITGDPYYKAKFARAERKQVKRDGGAAAPPFCV